ncbi:LysR family transcriptional regulator [Chitinimonas arctica]|uniref:LysR family transcriptional regulator n=1 Tax=Chitinimonas arctica TaxID=2594795 RepID=A0A516SHY0_9NEIS|nr:LysR family transcriptional regulator [Chitinimonas arctica]QDQ27746.1 LysR family transcriptional regulator [Chitinimonas arctica]
MLDPQGLAIFAAIIDAGSISGAAARLNIDKSVVSRQLGRLEAELGARLVQRSTRRLALTEIGEQVLGEARRIATSLGNIALLTETYRQEVRGKLRVTCPFAARRLMVELVAAFTTRYPQVDVALQLENRLVDLIEEQIDVAIRVSHLADSSLIARKLADSPRVLVAAPSYLARCGEPTSPADLAGHACLVYSDGNRAYREWHFDSPAGPIQIQVQGRIQLNDGSALVDAACAGAGILLIDRLLAKRELADGRLRSLLPDYPPPTGYPIYAVYPARDWLAPKTAAFLAFLEESKQADTWS